MVVLRATQKVLGLLGPPQATAGESDTALGDWYVNRIVVDRRPLLLLVSEKSLLSILEPAREVRGLPGRLPELVAARLERLGVGRDQVGAEIRAMSPVAVAKTRDRSVLGSMIEFARLAPYVLRETAGDQAGLRAVEAYLANVPCLVARSASRAVLPRDDVPRLLMRKWGDQAAGRTAS